MCPTQGAALRHGFAPAPSPSVFKGETGGAGDLPKVTQSSSKLETDQGWATTWLKTMDLTQTGLGSDGSCTSVGLGDPSRASYLPK